MNPRCFHPWSHPLQITSTSSALSSLLSLSFQISQHCWSFLFRQHHFTLLTLSLPSNLHASFPSSTFRPFSIFTFTSCNPVSDSTSPTLEVLKTKKKVCSSSLFAASLSSVAVKTMWGVSIKPQTHADFYTMPFVSDFSWAFGSDDAALVKRHHWAKQFMRFCLSKKRDVSSQIVVLVGVHTVTWCQLKERLYFYALGRERKLFWKNSWCFIFL